MNSSPAEKEVHSRPRFKDELWSGQQTPTIERKTMYRILSFDGGGIRGLVTLAILKRLEGQVPTIIKNADLLAGTSTGGIIALGLAAGKSVDEMISLYQDNGKEIISSTDF